MRYTSIGGQAVIEGVMMRSPHHLAVAVRTPDQKILIRHLPYVSVAERYPILKKPVLRGLTVLLESLFQGVDALSFSAEVSQKKNTTGEPEELGAGAIGTSIFLALIFGLGLFVFLPHLLAALIGHRLGGSFDTGGMGFHFLDGLIKATILMGYIYAISRMKEIFRVFQFHGAEHKSIAAFERTGELTVASARGQSRFHPRCGTSFLVFLVIVSIFVFGAVFSLLGYSSSAIAMTDHIEMLLIKVALMLPTAGLTYEVIKYAAARDDRPGWHLLVVPGLWVQRLTTREPDDSQLEVALASLRQVLRLEKGVRDDRGDEEFTIQTLDELGGITARVAEFPEE